MSTPLLTGVWNRTKHREKQPCEIYIRYIYWSRSKSKSFEPLSGYSLPEVIILLLKGDEEANNQQ